MFRVGLELKSLVMLFALHVVLFSAVLYGIYLSLLLGHWWPVAIAMTVVVTFDIVLLVRHLRKPSRTFQLRGLAGSSPRVGE